MLQMLNLNYTPSNKSNFLLNPFEFFFATLELARRKFITYLHLARSLFFQVYSLALTFFGTHVSPIYSTG